MNRDNLVLHAKASIERGSKSFARASKLFARQTRERAWLLYYWCRACDDLADGQDHGHGMSAIANPDKTLAAMRMMTARAHGGEQTGNPPFAAFGVVAQANRDALVLLVNRLCDLAGDYEASARVGASSLPFRSRWAVLAAAGIYGDIARAIRKSGGASLDHRIYTSKGTKLGWIVKAFGQALVNPAKRGRQGLWTRARTA